MELASQTDKGWRGVEMHNISRISYGSRHSQPERLA
jgi:hypothetical protein